MTPSVASRASAAVLASRAGEPRRALVNARTPSRVTDLNWRLNSPSGRIDCRLVDWTLAV